MLLCDIGNTSYHFFDGVRAYKKPVNSFVPEDVTEDVHYICVNVALEQRLQELPNWIDLEPKIERTNYYETMGIDRIMACEAVLDGVIVDAGSAVTVDVMRNGCYEGGFIYPGKEAFMRSFASISPALAYDFDTSLKVDSLPKSTSHALSYGFLAPLLKEITSYDLDIILTGGDAHLLKEFLPEAKEDALLLFKGMQKVLGGAA